MKALNLISRIYADQFNQYQDSLKYILKLEKIIDPRSDLFAFVRMNRVILEYFISTELVQPKNTKQIKHLLSQAASHLIDLESWLLKKKEINFDRNYLLFYRAVVEHKLWTMNSSSDHFKNSYRYLKRYLSETTDYLNDEDVKMMVKYAQTIYDKITVKSK